MKLLSQQSHRSHQQVEDKRQCFVVMPFGDPDLEIVYEDFVKPTLEKSCEVQCARGDDVFGSNVIMEDILRSIDTADVIIARPNKAVELTITVMAVAHRRETPRLKAAGLSSSLTPASATSINRIFLIPL